MNSRGPQRLGELLPGLLCGAVEDITGRPCRRIGCDGTHAWDGTNPWPSTDTQPRREHT